MVILLEPLKNDVRRLRALGHTFGEIQTLTGRKIAKSTLSNWCHGVLLPDSYQQRINLLNVENRNKGRIIAWEINKIKREEFFEEIRVKNKKIVGSVESLPVAKIALAMLCLGEASKSKTTSSFYLGNSDPKIIILFLELLKTCYDFKIEKIRCTVQCRADQNIPELEKYWKKITKVPSKYFYKSRIDPRTIGKPTLRKEYKGVLRIDYLDRKVQLDLESLADLIYNYFDQ